MINLTGEEIELGAKNISVVSGYENLIALTEEGLIEKRKDPGGGEPYFYVEAVADNMKFGVTISLREKKIEWLLLRWLDGPCTNKGWDGVSEEVLKDEYHTLSKFVEQRAGSPPNDKRNRRRMWCFQWGKLEVSYEPRSFNVAIFMEP
ncbi:hypothetical protein LK540_21545 [Massilia sp. IC2-278]|uniref:hypothetical protein n=1 Tax=Massilia sp. IC2-278 TaxID=2887200 RepID=UPI001E452E19|nr:hypothetical protein [Massilia sp. IC2-278]MCC2963021.1 hypothetical protein [Massilia sp. IC2-278]